MTHRSPTDYHGFPTDCHAFVTGAARGIGQALTEAGYRAGMRVTLADIDSGGVHAVANALDQEGCRVMAVDLDVTDGGSWRAALATAEAKLGPINLLVNAAAVSAGGSAMEDIPLERWRQIMDTNITGTFLGVKSLVPLMKARKQPGHIVNVASGAGLVATPNLGAFHTSKYAVVGLSEALRLELAPYDIGVTVVCPGPARTQGRRPDGTAGPGATQGAQQSFRARAVSPQDVAHQTLKAIINNDPYVVTHPELLPAIKNRFQSILQACPAAEES